MHKIKVVTAFAVLSGAAAILPTSAASRLTEQQLDLITAGASVAVSGDGTAEYGVVSSTARARTNGTVAIGTDVTIARGTDPTASTTVSGTDLIASHTVSGSNGQVAHSVSIGVAK